MEKIDKIRDFIKEQAEGLTTEIDEVQKLIMDSTMKPEEPKIPT